MCGNKYCDACKIFISDDHVCYMKTTAEEEATKLLKSKRKKKNNENEAVKKLIFFDFKCTQDDSVQWGLPTSAVYYVWKLQSIRLSYQSMPTRILSKEDVSLH